MNGFKDTPPSMLWGGILVPGAILSLVLFDLVTRKVYWLTECRPEPIVIVVYTRLWPIVGAILVKLGFAGALCCWFLLSNLEQTERYGPLLALGCVAMAVAGFAIFLWSVA
jgi:hypothetical protein